MSDGAAAERRAHLATLGWLRSETQSFRHRFPALNQATPAVSCTWEALQRQLENLADSPSKKRMVAPLVSATRKQAWCKPEEMVLREVLLLAGLLQDGSFRPGSTKAPRGGEEFPLG